MAEVAVLARQAGLQIWRRYGVPVYFYGAALLRVLGIACSWRTFACADSLKGCAKRQSKDSSRRPDVGGPELHAEAAGASAVGARTFLIAYNVYLAPGADISQRPAPSPAKCAPLRAGMQGVKALGLTANDRSQVSMNITDFRLTPMPNVFANLELVAREHGTSIAEGELIGLIPEDAYDPEAAWVRVIPNFDPDEKILERKLSHPLAWPESITGVDVPFLDLQHVNVVRGVRRVLHDINLSVQAGEQIALLGPNGCGKSTLLKTMTCELYPLASDERTRVSIFGRERWDLTELKKKLGVVQNEIPGKPMLKITGREAVLTGFFSSSTLWPNLTVTPEMHDRADAIMEQIDATIPA